MKGRRNCHYVTLAASALVLAAGCAVPFSVPAPGQSVFVDRLFTYVLPMVLLAALLSLAVGKLAKRIFQTKEERRERASRSPDP